MSCVSRNTRLSSSSLLQSDLMSRRLSCKFAAQSVCRLRQAPLGTVTPHDTTQHNNSRGANERKRERGGGGRTREKEGKRALTKAACRVSGRRALRLDARWRRLERHWLAAGSCARRALAGGGGVGGSAYTYRYIHTGIHSDRLRTNGLKSGERSRARTRRGGGEQVAISALRMRTTASPTHGSPACAPESDSILSTGARLHVCVCVCVCIVKVCARRGGGEWRDHEFVPKGEARGELEMYVGI